MADLVSRRTRGLFRDLKTDSTLGDIDRAFQDEGVPPSTECMYQDSSVRRTRAQEYLEAINWQEHDQVAEALRATERLVDGWEFDAPRLGKPSDLRWQEAE